MRTAPVRTFLLRFPLCVLLALIVLVPGTADAEQGLVFGLGAGLGYQGGNTTWALEATQVLPAPVGTTKVESELKWPLDFLLGAVNASLEGRRASGRPWALMISLATNLKDPGGEMEDSDWVTFVTAGGPRTQISYTESATDLCALIGDIGLRYTLYSWAFPGGSLDLDLLAGYRHEHYDFDAYGARGWQLDEDRKPVDLDESLHLIHYTTNHMLPYAGFLLRDRPSEKFFFDVALRVFGVFSQDYDNHLLRRKDADGHAEGIGVGASVAPRWQLIGGPDSSFLMSVGVDLNLEYLSAPWGTLSQAYYADDPTTPDDETQVVIPDADFDVQSTVFGFMGVVEVSF